MRILVTNDDGIDSAGLHVLARKMNEHGEVVVVAPDREFSGASSAIGAIWEIVPDVSRRTIDGVDEAWAVNGPPALCVMYARLGTFGDEPFDLVVSGINPGANVGQSVYYSGTIGACLSGRNGGLSGVAVSQATTGWAGVEGQGWGDIIKLQKWDVAAECASQYVGGLIANMPDTPVVTNINVPNIELDKIAGWRETDVARQPSRAIEDAKLVEKDDKPGHYTVTMNWGDKRVLPEGTDGRAVSDKYVSLTHLSHLDREQRPDLAAATAQLDTFFADRS